MCPMSQLLIALAVFFALLGVVAFIRSAYLKDKQKAPQARQDPFNTATGAKNFGPDYLGPGAVVSHGATDYVIRGSLTVNQGPYIWHEHMMDGGSGSEWLAVEVDEGQLDLVLWRTLTTAGDQAPSSRTEVDGITFLETERGHANYTSEGNTGLPPQGRLQYIDFVGTGNHGRRRLSYERYSDDSPWEISLGEALTPGELVVYPAPKSGGAPNDPGSFNDPNHPHNPYGH